MTIIYVSSMPMKNRINIAFNGKNFHFVRFSDNDKLGVEYMICVDKPDMINTYNVPQYIAVKTANDEYITTKNENGVMTYEWRTIEEIDGDDIWDNYH